MKIRFLLFALAIMNANIILAQTQKIQIGLEGGPNLAFVNSKERFKTNNLEKIGYTGGLSLQYDISKTFSLRTGIGFERKGYKERLYNPFTDTDAGELRIHFDYLTAPVLARVTLGQKINFFANAGPYFAYLLSIKDSRDIYKHDLVSWKEYYKRFDWGITAGVGAAIPVKENFLLTLEVRYNFGLYNNVKETYYIKESYNNSACLLAGVAYKF